MTLTKMHYIPQGYLRGFIHPLRQREQKPLWVLDVATGKWEPRSTSEIGNVRGLYEFSHDSEPVDLQFRFAERHFPVVRSRIHRFGYESWELHREFLVAFAAALTTRSLLFMEQAGANPSSRDSARDHALNLMRQELLRRPSDWLKFSWVLRFRQRADDSIPTADRPVVAEGSAPTLVQALLDPGSTIICPLSWDMVLLGAPAHLSPPTDMLPDADLDHIRRLIRAHAAEFIVSTLPQLDMSV